MDEEIDEETYSLFFSSLKHPVRRKILRVLAQKPATFSGILDEVNIDSGHLSYHLGSLSKLITHSTDNTYALSSLGEAAVSLMDSVEGPSPRPLLSPFHTLFTRRSILKLFILAILATTSSSLFMGENGENSLVALVSSLLAASFVAGYLPRRGTRVGGVNGLLASLLGGAGSGLVLGVQMFLWLPHFPPTMSVWDKMNWALMSAGASALFFAAIGLLIGPIGGGLGGLIGIKRPERSIEKLKDPPWLLQGNLERRNKRVG